MKDRLPQLFHEKEKAPPVMALLKDLGTAGFKPLDNHSYVLSVADRARIERNKRTTEEDPEKSFSNHWPSYLLALMLGPEHFGLPAGDIFKGDGQNGHHWQLGLHTHCKKGQYQFSHHLPPP